MRTLLVLALLAPQASDRWEKDIAAFEARDKEAPPPQGGIVFIGSSTIRLWKTKDAFPDLPVVNRGFGGSQIADSVRYADRIVLPLKPKTILLFAGGNDINSGKSPDQVFEDYKAFVAKIHAALPETRILFMSLYPNLKRAEQLDKTSRLNALVADHAKTDRRLGFVDVVPVLCPDGKPNADVLLPDQLHLNEKGYGLITPV
ncbi:MAG TPA: GDSL-type esterase/lipase family protein, partial [Planctomycetota bacterium]|nr:GDSL-type esterase/lipase family protein [Planctomycetota bacterium]